MLSILFVGDIVGEPGRRAFKALLPLLKQEFEIDCAIANAENAAAGRGITPKLVLELLTSGADVLTLGDHVWDQPDLAPWMQEMKNEDLRVLRPLNYPSGTPGRGSVVISTPKGRIGVISLQGRSFIQPPLENPFLLGREETLRLKTEEDCCAVFVDMHAETTSEKIAMGYYLDGLASALIGTHTHVQTADEIIREGGLAFLTDVGMCGPAESILGRDREAIIRRFCSSMPAKFPVAGWPVRLCGVVVRIDETTGRARSIDRIQRLVDRDGKVI